MSVPTLITDLSTTAASNPPAGSETPIEGDNHIRTAYAFIAQLNAKIIVQAIDAGSRTRSTSTYTLMDGYSSGESIDNASVFASNVFTAPSAGYYEVSALGSMIGNGGTARGNVAVYKNGAISTSLAVADVYSIGSDMPVQYLVSGIVLLAASDTLSIYSRKTAGTADCYFFNGALSIKQAR